MVVVATACAVGAAWGVRSPVQVMIAAAFVGAIGTLRAGPRWMVVPAIAVVAIWGGQHSDAGLKVAGRGPLAGVVELISDPERKYGAVSAVVRSDGRRYQVDVYGALGRRLESMLAGDRVQMTGRIAPLNPRQAARLASRHVVARLNIEQIGDMADPRPVARAANRVRELLQRGSSPLPPIERALFLGLVIGDDRAEPPDLVTDFRRSGLSHLTAVSGQNIGFLLVAFAPLLTGLRPRSRWVATSGLIAWFALLTRFEPSVLRAGVMAILAATVFWRGWTATPLRLLAMTVTGLTLIDPLISRSIGWWLSVGATTGIALVARPLARGIPGPRWFAEPAGASLAAQLGVMPVSVLVFHRLPLFGLGANLLAGAPAGFVMVWGIPAALVGGAVPWLAPLVQFPSLVATRWVMVVARVMAAAEPEVSAWVSGPVHLLAAILIVNRSRRRSERG